jgi:branched-chain amino acid transport system substrate-binding protein
MKKSLLLTTVLLLIGSVAFAEIKIGVMGPMTGPRAREGEEMKKVVELLAEQLNNGNGINGQKVKVIVEDDSGDPTSGVTAARRLCKEEVVAVIGTVNSPVTEATQTVFDKAGIIQIANGSTANHLSEKGLKYFFRTCPRQDEQAGIVARIIERTGSKKVAILHDNTVYSKQISDTMKTLLSGKQGGVFSEALIPGQDDYRSVLTGLKARDPEVVFFTGSYKEAGLLLRQKKEMNWNVQFIGGAVGFLAVGPPLPQNLSSQEGRHFLEDFRRKYNSPLESIDAAFAGDGFNVIVYAIAQTRSTDPDRLADYLHKDIRNFPGLTGRISFNDRGDRDCETDEVYSVNQQGGLTQMPPEDNPCPSEE